MPLTNRAMVTPPLVQITRERALDALRKVTEAQPGLWREATRDKRGCVSVHKADNGHGYVQVKVPGRKLMGLMNSKNNPAVEGPITLQRCVVRAHGT